jgi:hypothetical protein
LKFRDGIAAHIRGFGTHLGGKQHIGDDLEGNAKIFAEKIQDGQHIFQIRFKGMKILHPVSQHPIFISEDVQGFAIDEMHLHHPTVTVLFNYGKPDLLDVGGEFLTVHIIFKKNLGCLIHVLVDRPFSVLLQMHHLVKDEFGDFHIEWQSGHGVDFRGYVEYWGIHKLQIPPKLGYFKGLA